MSTTTTPIQFTQLSKNDLEQEGLPYLNNVLASLFNQVNTLSGATGKTTLPAGIDVKGSTVSGIGDPQTPTDAVSKVHAETNYSARALAPKLEAGGSNALQTYRALNSKSQQESYSTFLNTTMNTAPTCNSSIISAAAPSGGAVVVTVSAGYHYYVDGQKITPYGLRSDTLALPTSFTLTTLSRSAGIVTANTSAAHGFAPGRSVSIGGVADASFDGTFTLLTASGSTFTYAQSSLANAASTGGTVSVGVVYYYYLQGNSQTLALSASYPSDTQQNRLTINTDQSVLIAVAVLSSRGLDTTQSAAGATIPATTGNARILTRL